ncbi:hypothetical protein X801_08669, partial [Opisthorchis viverrini]
MEFLLKRIPACSRALGELDSEDESTDDELTEKKDEFVLSDGLTVHLESVSTTRWDPRYAWHGAKELLDQLLPIRNFLGEVPQMAEHTWDAIAYPLKENCISALSGNKPKNISTKDQLVQKTLSARPSIICVKGARWRATAHHGLDIFYELLRKDHAAEESESVLQEK